MSVIFLWIQRCFRQLKIIIRVVQKMIAGAINEQYRCLMEILTCLVCKEMVNNAHLCPNCSKFYCLKCIDRQLEIEEKCLNCNRHLNKSMLSNCQQLCKDLTDTMERVKIRGFQSRRGQDKSPYYCYRHKLQKTYYCQTCHKPLCSDCSVLTETHRGHEFIKLSIMKSQFKQKISQKQDEINAYIHNLDSRIASLNEETHSNHQIEHQSLLKVECSMKSLKDQLKKRLKRILREGENKLDLYNEVTQKWNLCYEKEMEILKSTSKGKFVEKEYNRLQEKLLEMLNEAEIVENNIIQTKEDVKKENINIDYLNPEYFTYIFLLKEFSQKQQSQQFFYTETVTTLEGLQIRLKVYPKGVPDDQQNKHKKDLKMIKRLSKNQDYLAIFIELVDGPITNTKQKHQLILNPQRLNGRSFIRQFESQFDVGLCWGYEHFIKLNHLFDEGYYNPQLDLVEVTLKIAPCNFYQAAKDQQQLLKVKLNELQRKRRQAEQLQNLIVSKENASTFHSLEEDV